MHRRGLVYFLAHAESMGCQNAQAAKAQIFGLHTRVHSESAQSFADLGGDAVFVLVAAVNTEKFELASTRKQKSIFNKTMSCCFT